MLCRNCGELVHRSRPQNLRESFLREITPYKPYRCNTCGWRGLLATRGSARPVNPAERAHLKRTVIMWAAALLLAMGIGWVGAMQIQSSARPAVVR
jgi:DNA-directed RNA polymerase subunit RPC12/RpoP